MLLDTFPAFTDFWRNARNLPLDEQIRGWEEAYLQAWPGLAAMQIEDYRAQGVDWQEIARDRVFPFLDERMQAMEAAHAILLELCDPIRQRAITAIGLSRNILFVVHVGLGCGAGWATKFQDSPAILFGLENIAELGWNSQDVLTGLIAHEIGHLAHYQWRAQGRIPLEDGPWSQLYDEGIAQCCESLILNTSILHQSCIGEEGDWLAWCTEHKSWLAAEFLRVVQANEPVSKFFGSWFEIQGRSETGYFLGQAVVEALMAKGCSLEGISQLDPEQAAKPILEDFSRE